MVFLHGIGASLNYFGRNVPFFARSMRAIALDTPGFGASDAPDVTYTVPWMAGRIARFLELKGVGPATLVGNSMGGAASIGVALDHPEMVERLVLMGSAGLPIPEKPSPDLMKNLQYDFTLDGMRRVVSGLTGPDYVPPEEMIQYRYEIVDGPEARAALAAINAQTRTGTLNYPEERLATIKQDRKSVA